MAPSIEALLHKLREQSGALAVAWTGPSGRTAVPRCGGAPWDAGLGQSGAGRAGAGFEGSRVLRLGSRAAARVPRLVTLGARYAAVRSAEDECGPRRLALAAAGGLSLSDETLDALFTALSALEDEGAQAERVRRRTALANLGRAAASAAHDLRNVLSTALLELDAWGAGEPTAEAGVRGSVASARDLARDFLELQDAPERRPVELVALVRRELERQPRGTVIFRGAEGQGAVGERDELWVAGRRDLIGRVVANLLGNALEASPRALAVEVSLRDVGGQIELTIADRGRGMDQAHLDRYLEPGATRQGTGFGSASVVHCLARVGGELWIESEPGAGTRCVVRLQRAPRPGSRTALVHDPDPVARWSWREVFASAGWSALDTATPEAALAWIATGEPVVVVTPRAASGTARVAHAADERGVPLALTGVAAAAGAVTLPRVADRASVEVLERIAAGGARPDS